jgi:hypothetical protein
MTHRLHDRRPPPLTSSGPPQFRLKGLLLFTAAVAALMAALGRLELPVETLLEGLLVLGSVAAVVIFFVECFRAR